MEGASNLEVPEGESKFLKDMSEGLRLTESQLQQVFKRHGLEAENPLNEKFDPNIHQAVSQQEAEGVESDTVITVIQKGYTLHGKIIRPSMVVVAK